MKGGNNLFVVGLLGLIALVVIATNPAVLTNLGLGATIGRTANWEYPVYACSMYSGTECQTHDEMLSGTVKVGSYGTAETTLERGSYEHCEVIGHEDWAAMTWEIDPSVTVRRKVGGNWKIIRLSDEIEFQRMICQVTMPEGEETRELKIMFFNPGTEPDEPVEVPDEPDLPPPEEEVVEEPVIEDVMIDGEQYEEVITNEDPDSVVSVIVDGTEVETEVITDSSGNKRLVITTTPSGFSDTEIMSMVLIFVVIALIMIFVVMRR